MTKYQYLIVGGGMTADAAVRGIRAVDSKGTIGLFTREPDQPYKRPLLSKGLWLGKTADQAWLENREPRCGYPSGDGHRVDRSERQNRARDDRGEEHYPTARCCSPRAKPRAG